MAKNEKQIFLFAKVIITILGVIMFAYSWVATFFDIPPIIQDWRIGLGIGFLIFVIGIGWTVYDLFRQYVWWAEAEIFLEPYQINRTSPFGEVNAFALLKVHNNEELPITDCYASLEEATNLYGGDLIPIELGKKERLKWAESKYSSDDCKIVIESKNDKSIHFANTNFQFAFCSESGVREIMLQGIYIIKIRIDGKMNGKDIKPKYFYGHLLMDRGVTDLGIVTRTIFNSGDWKKNKDIPQWYKERKIENDQKEN